MVRLGLQGSRTLVLLGAGLCTAGCRYSLPGPAPTQNFHGLSDECAACGERECGQRWDECLADSACKDAVECYRDCTDPDCQMRCTALADFNSLSNKVLSCLLWEHGCAATCSGRNWDCVGSYGWTGTESAQTRLVTLTHTEPRSRMYRPIAGIEVKVCTTDTCDGCDAAGCGPPGVLRAVSDERGQVKLELPATAASGAFFGHLRASGARLIPMAYYLGHPVLRQEWHTFTMQDVASTDPAVQPPANVQRGNVIVSVMDCARTPGQGVRFSASSADATTRTWYERPARSSQSVTTTDRSGVGGFTNLPLGPVLLTGYRGDTPVAAAEAYVHHALITQVTLYPLELADRPPEPGVVP
ncbi:MAG: hypothetical protein MJD61_10795 [Proteobacteria bacterium]|nr:hypothetical protein [Pseudomonadota bacterium]